MSLFSVSQSQKSILFLKPLSQPYVSFTPLAMSIIQTINFFALDYCNNFLTSSTYLQACSLLIQSPNYKNVFFFPKKQIWLPTTYRKLCNSLKPSIYHRRLWPLHLSDHTSHHYPLALYLLPHLSFFTYWSRSCSLTSLGPSKYWSLQSLLSLTPSHSVGFT